jgi:hypothetical protein
MNIMPNEKDEKDDVAAGTGTWGPGMEAQGVRDAYDAKLGK